MGLVLEALACEMGGLSHIRHEFHAVALTTMNCNKCTSTVRSVWKEMS